jgi:hypothetical protein
MREQRGTQSRMRRLAVLAGALAALAGCGDTADSLTRGDALTPPANDPAGDAPNTGAPVSGPLSDAGRGVGSGDGGGVLPDTGGEDVQPDVAVSAPSCAGAFLCDSFEAYTGKPGAPWVVDPGPFGGSLQVDTTKAYSGTRSVRASDARPGTSVPQPHRTQTSTMEKTMNDLRRLA